MSFEKYRDAFDSARNARRVLTRDEVLAAWQEGCDVWALAARNDELAAEYDGILAEEAAS